MRPATSPARDGLWPRGTPVGIAHRGATCSGAPENTAAAFAAARALGYRCVETDVRASADGVAVLCHDPDLVRVADLRTAVADVVWADLARVRVHPRQPPAPAPAPTGGAAPGPAGGARPAPSGPSPTAGTTDGPSEHPPTLTRLDEALSSFPTLTFNLDVKDEAAVAPLVRAVLDAGAAHRVCIASFSERRRRAVLRALAAGGARPATSAGRAGTVRFLAAARAGLRGRALAAVVGATCLQVPERAAGAVVVDAVTVAAARSAGLALHVWTVDDPTRMSALLDAGVDGLITDEAEVLAGVLAARGAWPSPVPPPPAAGVGGAR